MDLVTGAAANLADKLLQLLQDEYKLQKDVKDQVQPLARELESTHAALCKVAEVPYYELDQQVKLWASEAWEASYDMEDILDTFLVRFHGCHLPTDADKNKFRRLLKNINKKFRELKDRHGIANAIEVIKKKVDDIAKRRDRYNAGDVGTANSASTTTIDRFFKTLQIKESVLVGIDEPRDRLIKMLTLGDDNACDKKMKMVSVVGCGGLGKTTLAKFVYKKVTGDNSINYKAFVLVGQNPKLEKVFRDILLDLDRETYMSKTNFFKLDENQLISYIRDFLKDKRYFIVIDDVWDTKTWDHISYAFQDNNLGNKIMITTRIISVANQVHCTYELLPLDCNSSKELFHGRIFGSQDKCPESFRELSDKILKKCDGVPLAIITIASLLANNKYDITQWQEICASIGSGLIINSNSMYEDMRKILSLSYYDLPSHMKTCFLYLSMFPEDYEIGRNTLIWRWISEGFIQPRRKCDDLFEFGMNYFNDLINRSLVQPVEDGDGEINACRVHDMILDLICFLSREQIFITTSDDIEQRRSSESKKLRRLSLRNTTWPKEDVSKVRSIAILYSSIDSWPSFSCFGMLRVLDLEGTNLSDDGGFVLCVENLIHLRYLGLSYTGLEGAPKGIEKLQFLQVLRMCPSAFNTMEFPNYIFSLRQLICLEGVVCASPQGNLLRNLESLQVLSELFLDENDACIVEALGYLTQLVELEIYIDYTIYEPEMESIADYMGFIESEMEDVVGEEGDTESEMEDVVGEEGDTESEIVEVQDLSIWDALKICLGKLPRLQRLVIRGCHHRMSWKCWVPPPRLTSLKVSEIYLTRLPKWICPGLLLNLAILVIECIDVQPEEIQILGTLPSLESLILGKHYDACSLKKSLPDFVITPKMFPRLLHCRINNVIIMPFMFMRGAIPWVNNIRFNLRCRDFFSNGGLDYGSLSMDHLPSLQEVLCNIIYHLGEEEEEAKKLEEAMKHARDVHPNRSRLRLSCMRSAWKT